MDIWNQLIPHYFSDVSVDEVLMNGAQEIVLVRDQDFQRASSYFQDDLSMMRALQELAFSQGLRLDPFCPANGGLLQIENVYVRWHALLPPISRDGPLLSLRRQRLGSLSLDDFMDEEQKHALILQLEQERPVFIVGPTGSGKTSLLIALLEATLQHQRVAILEQVPEIPKLFPHWIRLAAQSEDVNGRGAFRLEQVFDELLRLRPDSIVIGELRQAESLALCRALLAGLGSLWCTLHTYGPQTLFARLAELSSMSEVFWSEQCMIREALLLLMQREKPRLSEAWLCKNGGWELIFSATKGR